LKAFILGLSTYDTLLFDTSAISTSAVDADYVASIDHVVTGPGGKGLVAAIAFRYLKDEPVLMSQVGRESEIERMVTDVLSTDQLLHTLTGDTRVWLSIAPDNLTRTYISYGTALAPAALSRSAVHDLDTSDVVYISAESLDLIGEALTHTAGRDIPIVSNLTTPLLLAIKTSESNLLLDLVRRSDSLIMNDSESVAAMSMLRIQAWSEIAGPRAIVITSGHMGGRWAESPFEIWHAYPACTSGPVLCEVGAGDTFAAGFVSSRYGSHQSVRDGCARGAELAGLKVSLRSASLASLLPNDK
jgi:sugar/nucleoside kinase (ribokinase family)